MPSFSSVLVISLLLALPAHGFKGNVRGRHPTPYSPEQWKEMQAREELNRKIDEMKKDAPEEPLRFRQVTGSGVEEEETQEQLIADIMPHANAKPPAQAYVPKDEELQKLDNALTLMKQRTGVDLTGAPMLIEKMLHPALDLGMQGLRAASGFVDMSEHDGQKTEQKPELGDVGQVMEEK